MPASCARVPQVVDALGGGGWGPVATSGLLAQGGLPPATAIGTVSLSEFFVTVAAVLGFIVTLGPSHALGCASHHTPTRLHTPAHPHAYTRPHTHTPTRLHMPTRPPPTLRGSHHMTRVALLYPRLETLHCTATKPHLAAASAPVKRAYRDRISHT